jgi:hypothetical protein
MRHVVERCPRCGVEHEASADSLCKACEMPLRAGCRVHSRETGWLDGPACDRCAREAAHPPQQRRASALPCPDFSAAAAGAAPASFSQSTGGAPLELPPAPPRRTHTPLEHLFFMLLMMLLAAGGGAMLGVLAGFAFMLSGRGTLPDTALRFTLAGAIMGLLFGSVLSVRYIRSLRAPETP